MRVIVDGGQEARESDGNLSPCISPMSQIDSGRYGAVRSSPRFWIGTDPTFLSDGECIDEPGRGSRRWRAAWIYRAVADCPEPPARRGSPSVILINRYETVVTSDTDYRDGRRRIHRRCYRIAVVTRRAESATSQLCSDVGLYRTLRIRYHQRARLGAGPQTDRPPHRGPFTTGSLGFLAFDSLQVYRWLSGLRCFHRRPLLRRFSARE